MLHSTYPAFLSAAGFRPKFKVVAALGKSCSVPILNLVVIKDDRILSDLFLDGLNVSVLRQKQWLVLWIAFFRYIHISSRYIIAGQLSIPLTNSYIKQGVRPKSAPTVTIAFKSSETLTVKFLDQSQEKLPNTFSLTLTRPFGRAEIHPLSIIYAESVFLSILGFLSQKIPYTPKKSTRPRSLPNSPTFTFWKRLMRIRLYTLTDGSWCVQIPSSILSVSHAILCYVSLLVIIIAYGCKFSIVS